MQWVVVAGQSVDVGLIVGNVRFPDDVGFAFGQRDPFGKGAAGALERFDITQFFHAAAERAVHHAQVQVALGVAYLAFAFDETIALATGVGANESGSHADSASEWQRAKHFKVTFRVDVERSRRVRYQFGIDGSPSAAPANRKRRKDTEFRVLLVYETQIARADPRRVKQHIPLIVGDLDGISPWTCLVIGQSGLGVVGSHGDLDS